MELITREEIFNSNFRNRFSNLDETNYLQNLVRFGGEYGLDLELIEEVEKYIKNEIINYIIKDYDIDFQSQMIDIIALFNKYSPKYLNSVNRYFIKLNNPYDSLQSILNDDFTETIDKALENDKEIQKQLLDKYEYLLSISPTLYKYHMNYNAAMKTIKKSIKTMSLVYDSFLSYMTLDGEISMNLMSYQDIERFIDKLIIEAKILNRFKKQDIERVLKKILQINKDDKAYISSITNDDNNYENIENLTDTERMVGEQNICRVILSNFFLNTIVLNTPTLRLSEISLNKIYLEIDNISEDDILNIIEEYFRDITEEEKEYIMSNFSKGIETNILNLVRN